MKKIILLLAIFTLPNFSLAYYPTTTHAGLSEQIVEFYNITSGSELTVSRKELVIQGSIDEDNPSARALNHFYDPVHDTGINGYRTAKDWALDPATLNDYSWLKILQYYAEGNERMAYLGLGHIIHLLEDMAVPDHTRNDPHIGEGLLGFYTGSSAFEDWAKEAKNRTTLAGLGADLRIQGMGQKFFPTLGEYFYFLAHYSNQNFFSDDTILSRFYLNPKIAEIDGKYGYGVDSVNGDKFKILKQKELEGGQTVFLLSDNSDVSVLSEYFSRLSAQVIPVGAGVIELFLKEGNAARERYQFEQRQQQAMGFWGRVTHELAGIFIDPIASSFASALSATREGVSATVALLVSSGRVVDYSVTTTLQEGERILQQNPRTLSTLPPFISIGDIKQISGIQASIEQTYPTQEVAVFPEPAVEVAATSTEQVFILTATSTEPVAVTEVATSTSEVAPTPPVYRGSGSNTGVSHDLPPVREQVAFTETTSQETATTTDDTATSTDDVSATSTDSVVTATSTPPVIPEIVYRDPVVINEIAWMGTRAQANDEWIELYNKTDRDIDLSGWTIESLNRQLLIPLRGIVRAKSYFLLERTASTTTDQLEDMIFTGALVNAGPDANLYLKNGTTTIDTVDFGHWPSGDNGQKRTMERVSPYGEKNNQYNWKTYHENRILPFAGDARGNDIFGTPGAENSVVGLYIPVGTAWEDTVWRAFGIPYFISPGVIRVVKGATLTIEPGVVIKFAKSHPDGAGIDVEGVLKAEGTETKPITFTSFLDDTDGVDSSEDGAASTPSFADWTSIRFLNKNDRSSFSHVVVRYGGKEKNGGDGYSWYPVYTGAVVADGATLTISDTVFEHNLAAAVYIRNGARVNMSGSRISDTHPPSHGSALPYGYGVQIYDQNSAAEIIGSIFEHNTIGVFSRSASTTPFVVRDNVFSGNTTANVQAYVSRGFNMDNGGNYDAQKQGGFHLALMVQEGESVMLKHDAMPYVLDGSERITVEAGGTLGIEAGTVLKSRGVTHTIRGTLKAEGAADLPIVFTSMEDDSDGYDTDRLNVIPAVGTWERIRFEGASSSDSIIEHAVIRYGGKGRNTCPFSNEPCMGYSGAVFVDGSSPRFSHIRFDANLAIALSIQGDSRVSFTNSDIRNTEAGVTMSGWPPLGGYGVSIGRESSPILTDNTYSGNAMDVVYR